MTMQLNADLAGSVVAQDVYSISAARKHKLGTRLVRGDKVYRYAKAGMTLTNTQCAVWGQYHQSIMYALIQAACPIGTNILYVTVANTDGDADDGLFAIDDLEGGSVVIFDASTNEWLNYSILGNTAVASGGGTIEIKIDGELPIALTTSDHVEVMGSPYKNVKEGNNGGTRPFVGVAMRLATTAEPYFWIQTWGPCWIAPQAQVGASANDNEVVFRHDGSIDLAIYDDAYTRHSQRAGYVMTRASDGSQGAPFIMLQLAP